LGVWPSRRLPAVIAPAFLSHISRIADKGRWQVRFFRKTLLHNPESQYIIKYRILITAAKGVFCMPSLLGVTNPVPGQDNTNINRQLPVNPTG